MRIFIFLYLCWKAQFAIALETDNYLVWDRDLKDSSTKINHLFKREIDTVIQQVNAKYSKLSCRKLTFKIADRFKTYPPLTIFIEDWLIANLSSDQIYPKNMKYLRKSIYRNAYGIFLRKIPLSPNIQVNDIYFGTDKLSHFTSTARSYLKRYLRNIDSGMSELEARKTAIDLGIFKEKTILGLKLIGVYSYGDLEANYQGFLFYENLCLSDNPYLGLNSKGKWRVNTYPDIKDYVNPYWDESFNLSYRSFKKWYRVSRILLQHYCKLLTSSRVVARMDYYRSILDPSFSVDYIQQLQRSENFMTPQPERSQSVQILCEKNNFDYSEDTFISLKAH